MATPEQKRFMQMACDLAQHGMDARKGGPFAAVIVKDGRIVGTGCNSSKLLCDPTAHGEVMAIRDACRNLQTQDLTGAEMYTSGEPCPMCMAAIYWCRIGKVYYTNSVDLGIEYGFYDKEILAELKKPAGKRSIKSVQIPNKLGKEMYEAFIRRTE